MAISWTPWFNVSLQRRLEVFSVGFVYFFCGISLGPICAAIIIYLLIAGNIYWKIICALYVAFYCYDIRSSDRGGRGAGVSWVRGLPIFKCFINYFPIDLVKTVDLPPDRNYLVCIFPHGILSFGAAANFGTNHSKWSTLFPGIRPKLTSLKGNYFMPIIREIMLSCGMTSSSANSLTTMLKQPNDPADKSNRDGYTSTAAGLIVGGVREQSHTYPDTYKLVIARRRGFVRIALQTGASLVPAISFGENNLYKIIDCRSSFFGQFIKKLCARYKKPIPPLCSGRGFLQYDFGIIPMRHPITTVIGAPIHLGIIQNPNVEELDTVHDLFCTRLTELFEAHKSKYIESSDDIHLEFV